MTNHTSWKVIILLCMMATGCKDNHPADDPLFSAEHENRIAFLGNSITQGGLYASYFELFLLTRYPDHDFRFMNCGIAGDQLSGVLSRIHDDVLIHSPRYLTVKLGMNDIGRELYRSQFADNDSITILKAEKINLYRKRLDSLLTLLADKKLEIILLTPSIYEQNAANLVAENLVGCNNALKACSEIVKRMGEKYGLRVVDLYSQMDSLNKLLQETWPDTTLVGQDRVHPQKEGHFFIAYTMIKELGLRPDISEIKILASRQRVYATGATIENASCRTDSVAFTYLPHSLPFPVSGFKNMADQTGFQDSFNREMLTVTHLNEGAYDLIMNGRSTGVFTNIQLNEGINLASLHTPQMRLAEKIAEKVEQKRSLISSKLRMVAFIEYNFAPEIRAATNNEEKQRIINARLKAIEMENYVGWVKSVTEQYWEIKENHTVILDSIQQIENDIEALRSSLSPIEIVVGLNRSPTIDGWMD